MAELYVVVEFTTRGYFRGVRGVFTSPSNVWGALTQLVGMRLSHDEVVEDLEKGGVWNSPVIEDRYYHAELAPGGLNAWDMRQGR
jgi:hypothetical protein